MTSTAKNLGARYMPVGNKELMVQGCVNILNGQQEGLCDPQHNDVKTQRNRGQL